MVKVYSEIKAKEDRFFTADSIRLLKQLLAKFIPAFVEDSKNQQAHEKLVDLYKKSKAYEHQLAAIGALKEIEMSHILGENDVVLPIIVAEYIKLNKSLKDMVASFELLKSVPTAYKISQELKKQAKVDVGSMLKSDLEVYRDVIGINQNLIQYMEAYKASLATK